MKRSSLLMLALFAFACGEAPDEAPSGAADEARDNEWFWMDWESGERWPATAAEIAEVEQEEAVAAQDGFDVPDSEYGTLQQAFSAPASYGIFSNDNRCTGTWGRTASCTVPGDKTLKFINALPFAGGGQLNYSGDFASAVATIAGQGFTGWTVNTTGTQASESAAGEGVDTCPGSALACALTLVSRLFESNGNLYIKAERCRIVVDVSAVQAYTSGLATTTLKDNFVKNLLRHELGHCMGLGHNSASAVMLSPAPSASGWSGGPAAFTAGEISALNAYSP